MNAIREEMIRRYGGDLFARLERRWPFPLSTDWFDERLMNLTMGHELLKVQLFRFVDSLPGLKSPESVASHLREYLDVAGRDLPKWLRWATRLIPKGGLPARWLARLARSNAEHLAKKFISGSNVGEAIDAVRAMRHQGYGFTIDLLGEATITEREADGVLTQYLELIQGLSDEADNWPEDANLDRDDIGPVPRVNVSVKLSGLFSQFDPIDPEGTSEGVRRRLRPILSLAKSRGGFVNFDMEQHSFKDTTIKVFRDILSEPEFSDWPDVGIAIQAYLKETLADLKGLRDFAERRGTPFTIRLVKGAYWDYETIKSAQNDWPVPVWSQKYQTDVNFEECAEYILDHRLHLRPAFGSHNLRSIAAVMAMADEKGIAPNGYEFQMLYGMADQIRGPVKDSGHRVRIYTPYGQLLPGMAYLVRRLLENTSNEGFLRAGFADGVPEDVLLKNPQTLAISSDDGLSKPEHFEYRNEPLADFSREESRHAMKNALAAIQNQLGRTYYGRIGGKPIETGKLLDSVNPSKPSEVVGRVHLASAEDARRAVEVAATAFESWRETPVETRAKCLTRAAEIMRRRKWELSAWIVKESGKPWREADGDVAEAIDFCTYYAQEMLRLSRPRRHDVAGEENYSFYEARGVAVVIAPWNFPLAILCGMTAAALVSGNPTIMKPAEQSPVIAALLAEIFYEAGVPPDVLGFLPGIGEVVGPVLVEHPETAMIVFTGSRGVGISINASAARTPNTQDHIKRVVAELGGKNAIIVDADADLDEAVLGVVDSAFGYAGQKCSACSRVIVLDAIYDSFVHRLVEATRSKAVGSAEDPTFAIGPVIDAEARERIMATIERSKADNTLAYPDAGQIVPPEGYFVLPHLFIDVKANSALAQDEIFGPVLAVIRVKDLDEALRVANGTPYALTGGVFSRSPNTLETVKRRFRVGNLYVNRKITGALVDRQPFGGFKMSGVGSKAGGPDYLLQFLVPRTITENTLRRGFAPVEEMGGVPAKEIGGGGAGI